MRLFAFAFFFILASLLATNKGRGNMAKPEKESLKVYVQAIVGERAVGSSDEHLTEVFEYVKRTLSELSYAVELHPFQIEGHSFQNIIARKKGVRSDARITVGAHFDSVAGSPGADDNASGVAVMLELARILKGREWNHTIEFIGF